VVLRRVRSIGIAVGLFLATTVAFPVVLLLAVMVDATRSVLSGRPWMAVRLLAVWWVFLAAVVIELIVLAAIWAVAGVGGHTRLLIAATRRVDCAASALMLRVVAAVFDVRLEVEGADRGAPGPAVVLVRHAGFVDTLLPNVLLGRASGMRLRYVLSGDLLLNPLIDVWGNRLPSYFVDRRTANPATTLGGIRSLGAGLSDRDVVVLFPEGARFTERRRQRAAAALERRNPASAARARSLRRVLPPHAAGTLALLEGADDADVVVMAHAGLEDFGDLRVLWRGGVVGTTARVYLRRIPRAEIPKGSTERVAWLWELWSWLDGWVERGGKS